MKTILYLFIGLLVGVCLPTGKQIKTCKKEKPQYHIYQGAAYIDSDTIEITTKLYLLKWDTILRCPIDKTDKIMPELKIKAIEKEL
jgi:hypothetical protein